MARVARTSPGDGGERYQRDPGRPRAGSVGSLTQSPSCPLNVDTGEPPAVFQRPEVGADREGSEPMRRTAAVIAGALLLLAGCNEGDGGGSASAGSSSTPDAPPAQVAVAPTDGATDVSPVEPLEITVTGGELGEVTLVDASGAPVPGTVAEAPADATDPSASPSSGSGSSASESSASDAAGETTTEVWTPD